MCYYVRHVSMGQCDEEGSRSGVSYDKACHVIASS